MKKNKSKNDINIFVLNCGSSSLKYKMISMPSGKVFFGGEVQRIASKTSEPSRIVHEVNGREGIYLMKISSYKEAFAEVMDIVTETSNVFPDIFAQGQEEPLGVGRTHDEPRHEPPEAGRRGRMDEYEIKDDLLGRMAYIRKISVNPLGDGIVNLHFYFQVFLLLMHLFSSRLLL